MTHAGVLLRPLRPRGTVPCRTVPYQTVAYRTVPYTYRFGWGSFAGAAVVFMFTVADTGLH